jgi:hypothetical protein
MRSAAKTSFIYSLPLKKSCYGNRASQTFSTLTKIVQQYVQYLYLQIRFFKNILNDLPNDTNYVS